MSDRYFKESLRQRAGRTISRYGLIALMLTGCADTNSQSPSNPNQPPSPTEAAPAKTEISVANIERLSTVDILLLLANELGKYPDSPERNFALRGFELMQSQAGDELVLTPETSVFFSNQPEISVVRTQEQLLRASFSFRKNLEVVNETPQYPAGDPANPALAIVPYVMIPVEQELGLATRRDPRTGKEIPVITLEFPPQNAIYQDLAPVITVYLPGHYDLHNTETQHTVISSMIKELIQAYIFQIYLTQIAQTMEALDLPITIESQTGSDISILTQYLVIISNFRNGSTRYNAYLDLAGYVLYIRLLNQTLEGKNLLAVQRYQDFIAFALSTVTPNENAAAIVQNTFNNLSVMNSAISPPHVGNPIAFPN